MDPGFRQVGECHEVADAAAARRDRRVAEPGSVGVAEEVRARLRRLIQGGQVVAPGRELPLCLPEPLRQAVSARQARPAPGLRRAGSTRGTGCGSVARQAFGRGRPPWQAARRARTKPGSGFGRRATTLFPASEGAQAGAAGHAPVPGARSIRTAVPTPPPDCLAAPHAADLDPPVAVASRSPQACGVTLCDLSARGISCRARNRRPTGAAGCADRDGDCLTRPDTRPEPRQGPRSAPSASVAARCGRAGTLRAIGRAAGRTRRTVRRSSGSVSGPGHRVGDFRRVRGSGRRMTSSAFALA